jgi:hypothetical protein
MFLGNEAISHGYGGITAVSRITGVSRTTITVGVKELKREPKIEGKVRRKGGGRRLSEDKYGDICEYIRMIVDGKTYGDPMRVLSYTTESLRSIAKKLVRSQ